jgi:hypothetical protein
MRIQAYVSKDHSFRWHLDTQAYVALVCLINTNGGQTCMVSPAITRLLRPLRYPLYPFPQVFDLLPCEKITLQAGDMLFMRGSRMLHRAVTADEEGERMLIVFAYDPPDKKQNPLMEMMVRRINF